MNRMVCWGTVRKVVLVDPGNPYFAIKLCSLMARYDEWT